MATVKETLYSSVANALMGSPDSLIQVLGNYEAEYLEDDQEFMEYLDEHVFNCVICGWWCPIDEIEETQSGEWACRDCNPIDEE